MIEGFLHLLWLDFLAQPWVVYVQGPAQVSVVLPVLFSLWIALRTPIPPKTVLLLVLGLFVLDLLVAFASAYWSSRGLHFFPAGELIWPVLVFLVGRERFSPWWSYPLAFLGGLFPDVFLAGQYLHWSPGFWVGVGGAGWHDELWISSLTTLLGALCVDAGKDLARWIRSGAFRRRWMEV
ncbi:hypothetical protein ACSSZE_12465 [Acidithiobacillus caldus]